MIEMERMACLCPVDVKLFGPESRWPLMAQRPWIVPIPGTTQMAHMLENIGTAAFRFTPAELAELNRSVAAIQIRGARLPDAVLVFSDVEAPPKR